MHTRWIAALLAAPLAAWVAPAQANPEESMNKAGCMACHAKDKKLVGPSFQQIAAKYKGQDAKTALVKKVREGGKGSFGPIPMSPNPPDKIGDAELAAAVDWILKQ